MDTSLVGYWRMNDNAENTTVVDSSGKGNNGTFNDATGNPNTSAHSVVGQVGNALSFDGVDDYVDAGNDASLNITNAITISAWAKTSNSYVPIAGNWYYKNGGDTQGYRLDIDGSGKARIYLLSPTAGVVSDINVDDNMWHYIVGTYTPSTKLEIYVDGILRNTNTTSIPASIVLSTHGFHIGYYYSNGDSYFNGLIDEVRIYNRALSAEEIRKQFSKGRRGVGPFITSFKE